MLYEKPEMELIVFEEMNYVITTSPGVGTEDEGSGNDHQFGQ